MLLAVEWGTVGEWFAGAAAAGALGVSLWVLKLELERDQRAQASLVAVWDSDQGPMAAGNVLVTVKVRNGSQEPIRDVLVECETWEGLTPFMRFDVVPPDKTLRNDKTTKARLDATEDSVVQHRPRLRVRFNDAAGRRWMRDYDGRLRRIPHKSKFGRLLRRWTG